MAESSLQQLGSELSAHQSRSQETHQLLQTLYTGITHCFCLAAPALGPSATVLVPVLDCHVKTHDPSLPDQATVDQLLAHLQQAFASHQNQSQRLASVSQQLEAYSADQAQAIVALQAAEQPQDRAGDLKQLHSEDGTATAKLLQLAESVAAVLANQADRLTQTQSELLHLHEQLSQAHARTDSAESELTACKEQLGGLTHAAQSAQASLQQVIMRHVCWWHV